MTIDAIINELRRQGQAKGIAAEVDLGIAYQWIEERMNCFKDAEEAVQYYFFFTRF